VRGLNWRLRCWGSNLLPVRPAFSHPEYRPDIDGLRAIAVLAVVFFHAFPSQLRGGFIGVDVFFVISGYLISTIIFKNLNDGTFSFSEFYSRRIRRIFPSLLLVLISSYTFGWFALLADEYKQLGKHILASAAFVSNIVLWQEAGYFDSSTETKPLMHLWSLAIEEQFYVAWPILIWFAWKCKFNILIVILFFTTASFYLNIKGIEKNAVAIFYSPQTRFWELLSGSLLAWLTLYNKSFFTILNSKPYSRFAFILYFQKKINKKILTNAISFFGLFLLVYGFWRINKEFDFPGIWAVVPVLATMLIIFAGPIAWINRTVLSNQIVVWFGLISYPLYLWHWPLLSFARIIESETPSIFIRIVAITLSVVLAWLTYMLIERPLRFRAKSNNIIISIIALMGIVGYTGYKTDTENGYHFRDSVKNYKNNTNELVRTPATDDMCLNYIGIKTPLFPYCRFTNVESDETVAVIGDSHAHVAYPGIASFLKERGKNTVLLANSGCPPFLGSPFGKNEIEKNACNRRIEQLLNVVLSHKDIKKIFIFTRGSVYVTGTAPITGSADLYNGGIISLTDFGIGIQKTIQTLVKNQKTVFYITENPELSYSAASCIVRPFRLKSRDCRSEKSNVLRRQSEYLMVVNRLDNVIIVDSLKAFCPDDKCLVFENDELLYADSDHLSVAGSRFQANQLLSNYLQ
jgi:peptidoglycan/LPS O-acetylase OafA/YrhL